MNYSSMCLRNAFVGTGTGGDGCKITSWTLYNAPSALTGRRREDEVAKGKMCGSGGTHRGANQRCAQTCSETQANAKAQEAYAVFPWRAGVGDCTGGATSEMPGLGFLGRPQ